ncbi:hypothetical protein [Sphingosinicella sp. CPCC 101087]|uniref:hypothetical protein n=1 Tax=Sphingosinicella sp. CPCC 101087 TaxID=2497754 RepID=UPI00101D0BDE|nr:hypothetical protein [Sphingosinicella sp. CPCC 101087]
MLSDGARPFVNENMGLSVVFPQGSRVCMSRSGDAPRGFYARYGTGATGCPEGREDSPEASMGLNSSFNATFLATPAEVAGSCTPPDEAILQHFGADGLVFPGHRSLACQSIGKDGSIDLTVYALAGEWAGDPPEDVPHVVYRATLGTRPGRLEEDLRMFRTFLGQARIGLFQDRPGLGG